MGASVLVLTLMTQGLSRPASAQDAEQELIELRQRLQQIEQMYRRSVDELEQRIEQLENAPPPEPVEEPSVAASQDNVTIELSGRINQAILFADNGDESDTFIVDNDNSASRLGIEGIAENGAWTTGAFLEISAEINTTDEIEFGQAEPTTDDFLSVRHAEVYFEHEQAGVLALGWGDAATEGVVEVDLSGTTVLSQSDVDDSAADADRSQPHRRGWHRDLRR